jgi:N-acetylmuramic acid 6-phosphate (MurNAc-6-P) etherase
LHESGNRVPVAMVMLQAGVDLKRAEGALKKTSGHVRKAVAAARKP